MQTSIKKWGNSSGVIIPSGVLAKAGIKLGDAIDNKQVHGLSIEALQKLTEHKPETIGQAGRISGITPATISILMIYMKRKHKKESVKNNSAAA